MWFRPGQQNESEPFRVSSLRNRIRRRKSTSSKTKKPVVDGTSEESEKSEKRASSTNRRPSLHAALNLRSVAVDTTPRSDKEKVLLKDRKFKSNRIAKSSSKTKVVDLIDKTPNGVKPASTSSNGNSRTAITTLEVPSAATIPKSKGTRMNANLNLNALLRYKSFISSTTKKLTREDFDRFRRKSLGENGKQSARKNGTNVNTSSGAEHTDDELFHSCNDDDDGSSETASVRSIRHASPSLTSRVAARLTEGVHKKKAAAKNKSERRKDSCYCYPTQEGC